MPLATLHPEVRLHTAERLIFLHLEVFTRLRYERFAVERFFAFFALFLCIARVFARPPRLRVLPPPYVAPHVEFVMIYINREKYFARRHMLVVFQHQSEHPSELQVY